MQFQNIKFSWNSGAILFLVLALGCIHFSTALSSIAFALAVVCCIGILFFESHGKLRIPFFLICLALFFIIQLVLDLLFHYNDDYAGTKALLKLPLLLAPLFVALRWKREEVIFWILCIALPLCWISTASVWNYFAHFAFYNQMVLESKPVPIYSQVYHIEFSVILGVISLLGQIVLFQQRKSPKSTLFWLLLVVSIINTVNLHILSARTGIIALWTGYLAAFLIFRLWRGFAIWRLVVLAFIGFGVLFAVPSLRNRIVNSVDDLKSIAQNKDLNTKSFGRRWLAWDAGISAIYNQPWTGYGMGNVSQAMEPIYRQQTGGLDEFNRIGPHNQYLETTIQSGILALTILLLVILVGAVQYYRSPSAAGLAFLAAFGFACVFESLLERQASVLLFSILLPLTWVWGKAEQ